VSHTTSDAIHTVLRERFGMENFRGQQEPVIRTLLLGKSALALFPTGAGKSLCYQLPALLFDGVTLVVSPLIALMKDQVESLQRRGIEAARIASTLADDEVADVINRLQQGSLPLLFLSPERLASRSFRKHLRGVKISLLAIDEAHCISEWGHNFRPDYLKIARLSKRLKVERILALTATATTAVAQEIRKGFRITKACQFHGGFHRPNLQLSVESCTASEKDLRLIEHLHAHDGPAIVYATSRQDTERLAALLQKHGFAARAYHAGLTAEMRSMAQESFLNNRSRIIVATIAFGMGIDKADIRSIIHYHLPKCIEGYSQEIGRAGRDGQTSHCLLFAHRPDTKTLENFIHAATPSPQSLRTLLDRLLRLAEPGKSFAISPYELSISQDMREETLRTVLAYLELDHIIERSGHFHAYFRVRLLRPLERVLAGYPAREKNRIRTLFAAAESAYGSLHFRIYEISEQTGLSREQATEIITSLADAGDIRLEQRGLREVYERSKTTTFIVAEVIDQMIARFESRASFEFERVRTVMRYVESRTCRARTLAKHFGVAAPSACGVCDICLGGKPIRWREVTLPAIPALEWQQMLDLRAENHASLGTPRQLARFFCGISSPAAYQAKLQSRDEFGLWQSRDFLDVLAMLEA
jgi:ATP-dependent DNA helicase RecQ